MYIISNKPETFLVDYPDQDLENGVGFKSIQADTTITLFSHYVNGDPQFVIFDDLIFTKADSTTRIAIFADVDSIVTVYSNVKIESLSGTVDDYHVTKVKWFEPYGITIDLVAATNDTLRLYDYDYHIFYIF